MLRRITWKQFREWQAYNMLEPFGEIRSDYRAAQIAQMIFNMAVVEESRKDEIDTFLLKFVDPADAKVKVATPKAPQTFEEQIAIAKIWAEAANKAAKAEGLM